jgi:aspartate racemase
MKTIGMIGGTGWLSTAEYYKIINQLVNQRLGGLHSAKILLFSVDMQEMLEAGNEGKTMEPVINYYIKVAQNLENAGADFLIICSNTSNSMVPFIKDKISIPIIHIADAVGDYIKKNGVRKVGLTGTRYTMQQSFYKDILMHYGIDTLVPSPEETNKMNTIIFSELQKNTFTNDSKQFFLDVFNNLKVKGAEGIIMGCTEIPLLIKQEDTDLLLFDTLKLHASAAVDFAFDNTL